MFQSLIIKKHLSAQDTAVIQSAYDRFVAHFHHPDIQANIRHSKEEQYQEGFLKDLFVAIFGYTLNPQPNYNLTTELKNLKGSKKCDGAILVGDNGEKKAVAVIELKGMDTTDLSSIEAQAFGYKNNHPTCRYVITSNFQKLRFYIDNAVEFLEFNLFKLSFEEFSLLYLLLQKDNLLNNLPLTLKSQSLSQEEAITKALYKDYSAFKRALFANICANNHQNQLILFNKTQKLLDRLLFIFFAEDSGLLPANTAHNMIIEWRKLKELKMPISIYEQLKRYFHFLDVGYKDETTEIFAYNGGLFKSDTVLDELIISDDVLYTYITKLADYDYKSEIDVNILGHIFENSLNEIDEIKAELNGESIDKTQTKRKKDGVFYTPKYITSYIVNNTIGKLCMSKKTELALIDTDYTSDKKRSKKTQEQLLGKLKDYRHWLLNITICDPACGSGAFLNEALNFLMAEHQYLDELEAKLFGDGIIFQEVANHILEHNLFGVDINEESVEIAKLSLWLRTAEPHRKLTSLNNNIKCGNSLINDSTIAGDKAFDWQAEFPRVFEKGGFDVVIGNPPYVNLTQNNTNNDWLKFYTDNFESIKKSNSKNLYTLFNEKSVHLLKDNGILSFIIPEGFLKTRSYIDCVNMMNANGIINKAVYFTDWVFADATTGSMIFEFIKNPNTEIAFEEYLCDKYQNFTIIEQKTNSIIEKYDNLNFRTLSDVAETFKGMAIKDRKNYVFDFKSDENCDEFLLGNCIDRYYFKNKFYTNYEKLIIVGGTKKKEKYQVAPRILVRRTGDYLCCHLLENVAYTESTLYSISPNDENLNTHYLLALLNSSLLSYIVKQKMITNEQAFPQILMTDLQSLKIPQIPLSEQQPLIELANTMLALNQALQTVVTRFVRMMERKFAITPSKSLLSWYELDFGAFVKELHKKKIKLTLADEAEWEAYFIAESEKARTLTADIKRTDALINQQVYALYGLSDDEIAMVNGVGVSE